jgi:hypothetical protein
MPIGQIYIAKLGRSFLGVHNNPSIHPPIDQIDCGTSCKLTFLNLHFQRNFYSLKQGLFATGFHDCGKNCYMHLKVTYRKKSKYWQLRHQFKNFKMSLKFLSIFCKISKTLFFMEKLFDRLRLDYFIGPKFFLKLVNLKSFKVVGGG